MSRAHAPGRRPRSRQRRRASTSILRAMRRDGVIDDAQLAAARESGMHFAQTALHAD